MFSKIRQKEAKNLLNDLCYEPSSQNDLLHIRAVDNLMNKSKNNIRKQDIEKEKNYINYKDFCDFNNRL